MKKSLLFASLLLVAPALFAQSYYDDDIYYDAAKAPKEKKVEKKKSRSAVSSDQGQYVTTTEGITYYIDPNGSAYPVTQVDMPGSDTYLVNTGNTRDVDEYNRRYTPDALSDSTMMGPAAQSDFANTRLIEKFSNPDIVTASGDDTLIELYESSSSPEVNIYVGSPYGYYPFNSFYDPWFYGPGWYSSWYSPYYWGPSWSWSWGWGPSWSWGWGPSWSWGWGPSWGWGGGWAPRPPHPSHGGNRPHYPGETFGSGTAHAGGFRGNNSSRPAGSAVAGSHSSGGFRGNSSVGGGRRPSTAVNGSAARPSTQVGGRRPSSQGSVGTVVNSRPANRGSYNVGNSRTGGRSTYTPSNTNNNRNTTPSYNTGGGSRGGFSGGSSRGGGGGRSSGGGGRGGRR